MYTPPSNDFSMYTMECLRWMSRHVGVTYFNSIISLCNPRYDA